MEGWGVGGGGGFFFFLQSVAIIVLLIILPLSRVNAFVFLVVVSSGSTIGDSQCCLETLHRTDAECLTLITLEILFFLNIIYIIIFFKLNMAAITLTKY